MKTWHKIAIGSGIALTGAGLLAYNKFQKTKRIFENLTYFPKISNFKISLKQVNFDLKIELTNHLADDLKLSTGGLVKLTKFIIYDLQGKVLSTLNVNELYKVKIPAYGKGETPTINVEVPLQNLISSIPIGININNLSVDRINDVLHYGFEIKTFYGTKHTFSTIKK